MLIIFTYFSKFLIAYYFFYRREQIAQSLNLSQPTTDSVEMSNVSVGGGEVDNKQQQQLKVRGKKCLPYFP